MSLRATLEVSKLSYHPKSDLVEDKIKRLSSATEIIRNAIPALNRKSEKDALIHDVSFMAKPFEVTAIMSHEAAERRTVVELVSGRRHYGYYSGTIRAKGVGSMKESDDFIAFVPRAARDLYIPGLTFLEALTFSARIRLDLDPAALDARVAQVLEYMGLTRVRHRVIPERPTGRGALNSELRRLWIAIEIIRLPPIMIMDDPTFELEAAFAEDITNRLRLLADDGYAVITSLPRPIPLVFSHINSVVLLAGGVSIFASNVKNIEPFFCSRELGYKIDADTDIAQFLLDVSTGVERPTTQRTPHTIMELQCAFDNSSYNEYNIENEKTEDIYVPISPMAWVTLHRFNVKRSFIILYRAIYVKFKETEVQMKLLKGSIIIGLFMGYFLYDQGKWGDYCMTLLGMPYTEVTNLGACIFIINCVPFVMNILNIHIVCQKLKVFRHERSAGFCPILPFWAATLVAEIPFCIFYAFILSTICYFMVNLGSTATDFWFFIAVQCLTAVVGLILTLFLAAILRREILVRDTFLFALFTLIMTSGFPFQYPYMRDDVKDMTVVNPFRWSYESLMVWLFNDYPDGERFLSLYDFQNFDHNHVYEILINFIVAYSVVFMLGLFPIPTFIKQIPSGFTGNDNFRDSVMSIEESDAKRLRASEGRGSNLRGPPMVPNVLFRVSSSTGKSHLTTQPSYGGDEENSGLGPNITLHNVTYSVTDRQSPMGYRTVLHDMSSRIDRGELCVLMGGDSCGKSTLLHLLSGNPIAKNAKMQGSIYYNGKPADKSLAPWQRCALIESNDFHLRDLSVIEVLTFAMRLRAVNNETEKVIEDNVRKAMELLQLTEYSGMKTKLLNAGALRRLSIAEEIVHGPTLILVDEPITDLEPKDISIIMSGTLRELVNQDRTVIATMHQPSSEVFELFDTLLLLSYGRLIYRGPASKAMEFFTSSVHLQFDLKEYSNPAFFLADIAGGRIADKSGEGMSSHNLENHYKGSRLYELNLHNMESEASANPMTASVDKALVNGFSEAGTDRSGPSHKSMDMSFDYTNRRSVIVTKTVSNMTGICVPLMNMLNPKNFVDSIKNIDVKKEVRWSRLLLHRSMLALFKRKKTMISTVLMHVFIALSFGWILKDDTTGAGALTSFFGLLTMLLLLTNLQLVFIMNKSNNVFLKEHARGLYSSFANFAVGSMPMMVLRCVHAFVFSLIAHKYVGLEGGERGEFFYLCVLVGTLAGTMMVESLVTVLPDIRSAYSIIPSVIFLLFFLSGLFIKPDTLPGWGQPWMPSVSIIRWGMQALSINEFQSNTDIFPEVPFDYSMYDAYMALFGWGGKTKWDCFYIIVLNLAIYRSATYLIMRIATAAQVGRRHLKVREEDDRMY